MTLMSYITLSGTKKDPCVPIFCLQDVNAYHKTSQPFFLHICILEVTKYCESDEGLGTRVQWLQVCVYCTCYTFYSTHKQFVMAWSPAMQLFLVMLW